MNKYTVVVEGNGSQVSFIMLGSTINKLNFQLRKLGLKVISITPQE